MRDVSAEFAEVERVSAKPGVLGVDGAAADPLAEGVPFEADAVLVFELLGDVAGCAGDGDAGEFPVAHECDVVDLAGGVACGACDGVGVWCAGEFGSAFGAVADDDAVVVWCERCFDGVGGAGELVEVVACGGQVECFSAVDGDGLPGMPPSESCVPGVELSGDAGEGLFGLLDKHGCVDVDGQWSVSPAGRVLAVSDACLAEHDAGECGQLDAGECVECARVSGLAVRAESVGGWFAACVAGFRCHWWCLSFLWRG